MTDIVERLYDSPLSFVKQPIWVILSDLASQENCDGEPYDQMLIAVEWMLDAITEIRQIRADNARLREALGEIEVESVCNIPFYAFGDNQAACEMSGKLDYISAIARRALSDAPQSDGWVSVEDRLPDAGKFVNVYLENGERGSARFLKPDVWVLGQVKVYGVTHWMPLPSAPQSDKYSGVELHRKINPGFAPKGGE